MRFKITPFRMAMFNITLFLIFSGWWILFFILFAMVSVIAIIADGVAIRTLH
jgi:uncharacterized membrane protein YccF (DUF307 family)